MSSMVGEGGGPGSRWKGPPGIDDHGVLHIPTHPTPTHPAPTPPRPPVNLEKRPDVPPPPPRVEEPTPPLSLVGEFRFKSASEWICDRSQFGKPSTITSPPGTVPDGIGFVEKWLRGKAAQNAAQGLHYRFYTGVWSNLPNFDLIRPVSTGVAAGFDLTVRSSDAHFGMVFFGEIKIEHDDAYTFFVTSDDGSRLWIGNTLVVDNDGLHGPQERSGVIRLNAGQYPITLSYFQREGGLALDVQYQGQQFSKRSIPTSNLVRGEALLVNDATPPILNTTPGIYRLFGDAHLGLPFVYQDPSRSFFVEPHEYPELVSSLIDASPGLYIVDPTRAYSIVFGPTTWRFSPFYNALTGAMIRELGRNGIAGLYASEAQFDPQYSIPASVLLRFNHTYGPSGSTVVGPYPTDALDFSTNGPYALYNWEVFFHIPLWLAERLAESQQFEAAQKWLQCIFDPTFVASAESRYWRCQGLRDLRQESIDSLFKLFHGSNEEKEEEKDRLARQLEEWRRNPFDPHGVSMLRPTAYQRAVVMKYIDNLIAWGDQLFRRDTLESINEATLLYVLAADLLGPRPEAGEWPASTPLTFEELSSRPREDWLVDLENDLDLGRLTYSGGNSQLITAPHYFCVPENEKLLSYWDTVADRLFKIRHCLNIEGAERELPLFEPPIDPDLLVRAAAAGIDLSRLAADVHVARPPYRFMSMLQGAKELCNDVKALGAALLAALEKRDAEHLSLLRAGHEVNMVTVARALRRKQVEEAKQSLLATKRSREAAEVRFNYYRDIARINAQEKLQLENMDRAFKWEQAGQAISAASSAAHLIPNFDAGVEGFSSSPVTKASFGGANLGYALQAAAGVAGFIAAIYRYRGTVAGIQGGFDRRWDDWKLQEKLAKKDIEQLDRQILAGEIRVELAERELANHELQIENAKEAYEFMRDKYTDRELYDWMVAQISTIYFQTYALAYDVAKRAQRAYQYELGTDEALVEFGYWDSLKRGLLAGEKLYYDLKRMESSFVENNRREHEITKHISLSHLDPIALVTLKATGECYLELPEAVFDLDVPGHYMRRIKAVSVSVPSVTGPYTSVNCKLTLLGSTVRKNARLRDGRYLRLADAEGRPLEDDRFVDDLGAVESIVTSTGRDDSGLFEQNLRDERYLPFEGAGAVSRWRLQLPKETNRFDFDSITDVVLHLRYTARDGGEVLKQAAWDAVVAATPQKGARLFVARQEFPDAWHRFGSPVSGAAPALAMDLVADRFPFQPAGRQLRVTEVELFAAFAASAPGVAGTLVAPDGQTYGFEWPTNAELRHARVELPSGGLMPGLFRLELAAGSALPSDLAVVCHYEAIANG